MAEVTLDDGSVIQVPHPRLPPEPSIQPRRREELARKWLVSLSQAPSPERIAALAPLVGRFRPHSPLGKIASHFVAGGRLPAPDDVVAAYLHQQATRTPRATPAPVPPGAEIAVVELIDEHWAQHGHGPAWSYLGKQAGLDRPQVQALLREMKKAGTVTFTSAPGSLRRTPSTESGS